MKVLLTARYPGITETTHVLQNADGTNAAEMNAVCEGKIRKNNKKILVGLEVWSHSW